MVGYTLRSGRTQLDLGGPITGSWSQINYRRHHEFWFLPFIILSLAWQSFAGFTLPSTSASRLHVTESLFVPLHLGIIIWTTFIVLHLTCNAAIVVDLVLAVKIIILCCFQALLYLYKSSVGYLYIQIVQIISLFFEQ